MENGEVRFSSDSVDKSDSFLITWKMCLVEKEESGRCWKYRSGNFEPLPGDNFNTHDPVSLYSGHVCSVLHLSLSGAC